MNTGDAGISDPVPATYVWRDEFHDTFADRSVLLTGSAGFVGGHVAAALALLGADVTTLDCSAEPNAGRAIRADLRDSDAVARAIRLTRPDFVFHLAGVVDTSRELRLVRETLETNVLGTVNLLLALAETDCTRVVTMGSSEEIAEEASAPISPYAASKLAATSYSRMFASLFALPVVVARPFMSYGPGQQPQKIIPYTICELLAGRNPVIRNGNRICDLIYVTDLVRGLLYAVQDSKCVGQVVEIGTGVGIKLADVVAELAHIVGSTGHPVFDSTDSAAVQCPQVASAALSTAPIGWEPRWQLRDGLRETVAWYRQNIPTEVHAVGT